MIKNIKTNKRKKQILVFIYAVNINAFFLFVSAGIGMSSCSKITEAYPTNRQLQGTKYEQYALVHFGVNTFFGEDGCEGGFGDPSSIDPHFNERNEGVGEPPESFNPTNYNPEQGVSAFKDAGLTMVVLVAKHHDGFCLGPSKYTDYSVKYDYNFQQGKGDVVRDVSSACYKYGLKFGVYLSPGDRHNADYGLPGADGQRYVEYYRNQLNELLTNYGEVSEIGFDGAQGGSGGYGGANEIRTVKGIPNYYRGEETYKLVRKLQPNAVMNQGPDLRWCGSEYGKFGNPNGNTMNVTYPEAYGSIANDYYELKHGDDGGKYGLPAEMDISIRPEGFYHHAQDNGVKDENELFRIYLTSVGQGAGLIISVPPDRTGQINQHDIDALMKFKQKRDAVFANKIPGKIKTNKKNKTYEIDFDTITSVEYIVLQEDIKRGQHIRSFNVDAGKDGQGQTIATHSTIGYKRIVDLTNENVQTNKIQISITDSNNNQPCISNLEVYSL